MGGITSVVHAVIVEDVNGSRTRVVLRRYTQGQTDRASTYVEQETKILTQLSNTTIPAPHMIASDATGENTGGVPALLMTLVPGRMELSPKDPERFVREMAEHLVRIHEAKIDGRALDRPVKPTAERIPAASTSRTTWMRALDLMNREPPPFDPCFLHRDYQHFNMLWSRGRLTGIVDWPFASTGPRELDVGHCRLNLAVLFSAEWAELLRLDYEKESGRTLDPWWDVRALWSFHDVWAEFIPQQIAGRRSFDLNGMWGRVDELLASALKRA